MTLRQNELDSQQELNTLMAMISPSLKQLIIHHLFQKAVTNLKILNNESDEVVKYMLMNIEAH